jgi:hypothetical protein
MWKTPAARRVAECIQRMQRFLSMLMVGDKVKVRSSGAVGVVTEAVTNEEIYVEFDHCAGTRTCFSDEQLELVRPTFDMTSNVEMIQADKGL